MTQQVYKVRKNHMQISTVYYRQEHITIHHFIQS